MPKSLKLDALEALEINKATKNNLQLMHEQVQLIICDFRQYFNPGFYVSDRKPFPCIVLTRICVVFDT